jgi:aspartate aminotransferase
MTTFSRHAGSLVESETLAITAKANRLRSEGVDVAPFAAGEPDFDTPEHIKAAGIQAIREGRTKYGPAAGIGPLREAVAHDFRRKGFEGLTADRTIVGVGAKGVLFLALAVLLEEGDEVLVPAPAWLSYGKMVQAAGAHCVFVETSPGDGYQLDPDRLEAAVTPRTKAIVLNSPGNPTGAVQPDDVQREVGRIALRHGLVVISDEIYEHLVYAPATFRSFAELCPEARDLTLVVNGVSKAYAMTGWRIGYAGGPKDLIQRMIRLQSHALSGPPEICQRAALAALEGPTDALEHMRGIFAARRDLMFAALTRIPGVTCQRPDGAFYMLPDVSAAIGTSFRGRRVESVNVLAELLIEHARAAVVPGDAFEAPYALRFSYACSTAHIEHGTARVQAFFQDLLAGS